MICFDFWVKLLIDSKVRMGTFDVKIFQTSLKQWKFRTVVFETSYCSNNLQCYGLKQRHVMKCKVSSLIAKLGHFSVLLFSS